MGSRRRRSVEEIQGILGEWRSSGLSLRAFGEQQGLVYTSLLRWRQQHGKAEERVRRPAPVDLQPVQVVPDLVSSAAEIRFPTGIEVRVPVGMASDRVAQLMEAVRQC